jgi:hypothetical protein
MFPLAAAEINFPSAASSREVYVAHFARRAFTQKLTALLKEVRDGWPTFSRIPLAELRL